MATLDLTGKTVEQVLRSYTGHKSWVTRCVNKCLKLETMITNNFTRAASEKFLEDLKQAEQQLAFMSQIADYLTARNHATADAHRREVAEQETTVADLWATIYQALSDNAGNAQAAPAPAGNAVKPVSDLKPQVLAHDSDAATFSIWKRQFRAYFSASNMAVARAADQQAYLLTCLDNDLSKYVMRNSTDTTPILAAGNAHTCTSILNTYFEQRYPALVKRKLFFAARQKDGQTEEDYCEELRSLADEADIANMTLEDSLCLMYITGLRDVELVKRLGEIEDPTIRQMDAIIRAHANSKATTAATSRATKANQGKKSGQPGGTPMSDWEKKRRAGIEGKCYRCGSNTHRQPACTLDKKTKCTTCKRTGHVASVCGKPATRATQAETSQPNTQQDDGHSWPALEYNPDTAAGAVALTNAARAYVSEPTPAMPL